MDLILLFFFNLLFYIRFILNYIVNINILLTRSLLVDISFFLMIKIKKGFTFMFNLHVLEKL